MHRRGRHEPPPRDTAIRKIAASYAGENRLFAEQYLAERVEVEFAPQGTLAGRLRAGGAGIPALYTRTSVGTPVADGKPAVEFGRVTYVQERAIVAGLSLRARVPGDAEDNLRYRYASRNFNPVVATAGHTTVAEVELFVDDRFLDPGAIDTPGIFVDSVVLATHEIIVPGLDRGSADDRPDAAAGPVAGGLAAMESGDLIGKIVITP